MPLGLTDYESALGLDRRDRRRRERGYVCVCNVHTVMAVAEDPELRTALLGVPVNVPDGQPLVWALNLLGHSLHARVYGPELMARHCARAAESGQRLYLYGGRNQGALVQLALNLRQRYPGVRIVGGYSPPHRPLTDEERAAVIRGDQRLARRRRVGRDRRPQAGEVDGRDARRARGARAGRRRRRVRLPRRTRPPGARRLQEPAWSGPTGSSTSPAACGDATCATTRASCTRSRASSAARRRGSTALNLDQRADTEKQSSRGDRLSRLRLPGRDLEELLGDAVPRDHAHQTLADRYVEREIGRPRRRTVAGS